MGKSRGIGAAPSGTSDSAPNVMERIPEMLLLLMMIMMMMMIITTTTIIIIIIIIILPVGYVNK